MSVLDTTWMTCRPFVQVGRHLFYRFAIPYKPTITTAGDWGYIVINLIQKFAPAFTVCASTTASTTAPYIGTPASSLASLKILYTKLAALK